MRLTCPICGERDRREFYYMGAYVERPAAEADPDAWHAYVHLRDNSAGETRDLWHHEAGCGAWLVVTRNTVTHEISECVLVAEAGR